MMDINLNQLVNVGIYIGLGGFALALGMLVRDYINNKNRKASAVSILLIFMMILIVASALN